MSGKADKNTAEPQSNDETEPMSKSAKKRAKKQQKALEEKNNHVQQDGQENQIENSSINHRTSENTEKVNTEESANKTTTEKLKNQVDKLIPVIKRFDINGKPLRTIAGNGVVHLGEITPHNILQLKKLNEAVFPIVYNDKFYAEARFCGDLGRLAFYNDVVVGAVCCRIDDISDEKSLYIMTLGTLAAYRQIGIGTILIDYVLKLCKKMDEIKTVYLHVQVNNTSAVKFYEKHGFTNDGIIEDYYRISPRNAFLLMKRIRY